MMKRKIVVGAVTLGIVIAGLVLAKLISNGLRIPCLFNELTHLRCPGCGNTRATLALLRLDLKAMLGHNLLYPLEMLYILRVYLVCAGKYIRGGRFAYHTKPDWVDILCLALFLLWAVVRNLLPVS